MKLSRKTLKDLPKDIAVRFPEEHVFQLPQKVLQFGAGVFLRGLIDYIIDEANSQGIFNGRVVVIKSTEIGDINTFKNQDNLYTLIMQSVELGEKIEKRVVCASISQVIKARDNWDLILEKAGNPDLQIIVSNTTENGISKLDNDRIDGNPPLSFPGKLLSILFERYKKFKGSHESGFVIIPTELIPDNAIKLKNIINELAIENQLGEEFLLWLNNSNEFCNSLVDRIVPGKPSLDEQEKFHRELSYEDDLIITSETYALWAIEARGEKATERLSFSRAHSQIYLVTDIEKFRELKLRLLNGSHNLSCAVGFLAGFRTVKEAMADDLFGRYIEKLIQDEIAPSIVSGLITLEEAKTFGSQVLDRYRNPYIEFDWLDICVQDTSKIRIRAVPIILECYKKNGFVTKCISLSIAAYILFMKSKTVDNIYLGNLNGVEYLINDDFASNLNLKWNTTNVKFDLVQSVLSDSALWGVDLSKLENFPESVTSYLEGLESRGFKATVTEVLKKTNA